MSDPTTPGQQPSYDAYDAPAYGDVADEPDVVLPPAAAAQTQPSAPLTPPMSGPNTGPNTGPPPPPQGQHGWNAYPAAGAPYGTPYGVPQQYLANPNAPTHGLATTSLVLGIIGLASAFLTPLVWVTLLGVVCSPFAIWLGARARKEINANPQKWGGSGVAMGGIVTGIIGLAIGLLMLLFVVFILTLIFGFVASAS